jgi:hypothetical protein
MLDENQKITFFGLPKPVYFNGRRAACRLGAIQGRGVMPEDVWYTGSISEINA